MQFFIGMISFLLAMWALTDMHFWCRHSLPR
jgi:hypothetical protein